MQSEEIVIQQLIERKMDSEDKFQESRIRKSKPLDHDVPQNKARPKKRKKAALSLVPEVAVPEKASPASGVKLTEDESNTDSIRKASTVNIEETGNHIIVSNDKSQTECTTDSAKPQAANTWIQKSSWRELVGESGNSSFSISKIFPGMNLEPNKQQNVNESITISNSSKPRNPGDSVCNISSMQKRETESDRQGSESSHLEQNVQVRKGLASKDEMENSLEEKGKGQHLNDRHQEQRKVVPIIEIGQVCTFMRSAESLKQWSKLKAALVKKKAKGTDDSKVPKGKPNRGRR